MSLRRGRQLQRLVGRLHFVKREFKIRPLPASTSLRWQLQVVAQIPAAVASTAIHQSRSPAVVPASTLHTTCPSGRTRTRFGHPFKSPDGVRGPASELSKTNASSLPGMSVACATGFPSGHPCQVTSRSPAIQSSDDSTQYRIQKSVQLTISPRRITLPQRRVVGLAGRGVSGSRMISRC
jgi:hypothetical protein